MTDTPPEFAEDVRKCAGDSGRREAGGQELAQQKAKGQGRRSSRCPFVEKGAGGFTLGRKLLCWSHERSEPDHH